MENGSGIELSLLEGMDETLLERLYQAGIRSRGELAGRIATPDGRQTLARELGVSARRLQILHHLNFLLPEERAERELDLERRLRERSEEATRDLRQLWRVVIVALFGVLACVLAILFLNGRERGASEARRAALEARIEKLEETLGALAPIGRSHAEEQMVAGLARLGPAPGWTAPGFWPESRQQEAARLLGDAPEVQPARAVSLLLYRLSDLEQGAGSNPSPLAGARAATEILADLPPPETVTSVWDAAAVILRSRLRDRALGLAPVEDRGPLLAAAEPWEWTSAGYLTCEELLARLESMPLREEALEVWSRSLIQLREAADLARQDRAELPEAFARDYWIRRAELEYAVTAALLGRNHLLPYHADSPRAFIATREIWLTRALEKAPPAARPALAWLAVDYAEGGELVSWLRSSGTTAAEAASWVEALDAVESQRAGSAVHPGSAVEAGVTRAVRLSGGGDAAFAAKRTRVEAGLRPLLMRTRAEVRAQS